MFYAINQIWTVPVICRAGQGDFSRSPLRKKVASTNRKSRAPIKRDEIKKARATREPNPTARPVNWKRTITTGRVDQVLNGRLRTTTITPIAIAVKAAGFGWRGSWIGSSTSEAGLRF